MSNAERQRQLRKRNPGYYARIQARKRAMVKAAVAQFKAAQQELAAQQALAAQSVPLALPAPVETIELVFPELEAQRAKQTVPVEVKRSNAA